MLNQTDRWLRKTLMATAIALGVPSLALAQETPPPETPAQPAGSQEVPAAQPAPAAQPVPAQQPPSAVPPPQEATGPDETGDVVIPTDAESEEVFSGGEEVIVVTGSIIERRELTTPAPLAVLDKADLDAAGVASIGQILQNLPSQSNAINVQFNNGGDGSTRVSLRGLGAGRTLVLVNGRRHVAGGTGADASVDLNAIPTAIIERVEVLKDGASAVYGSDAIGGVVNIITRSNFEGSEVSLYTGITGDGHGQVFDVSGVTGLTSDRGNLVFAAGYTDQQPIGAGDRSYSQTDKFYDWDTGEVFTSGSTSVPQGYVRIPRLPDMSPDVTGNDLWQSVVAQNPGAAALTKDRASGSDRTAGWRTFNANGNADANEGDLYNYQPENYLVTPQKRYNVFSTGSYKLHDYARAFFEATYSNRKSDQRLAPEPLNTAGEGIVVSADNIYNPFGRPFGDVRRRMVEGGPRRSIQDIDTFRLVTGLDGRLPEELPALQGWRWSLAYNYGRTDSKQDAQGNYIRNRVANALGPSFIDADGTPTCGTPDAPIDGCVPLNFFGGQGTIDEDMLDYISFTGTDSGYNQQQMAQLNVTGKLFEIPGGGDAALAIGAEYRAESGADLPNPLVAKGEATGNKRDATSGDYDVREGYAELSIVPLVGQTGAEWVELNAALRAFDYNTFGADYTWKAGGLWRIGQGVAVRGTYSTAFRAPPISSLYSGQTDGFPAVTDPCDTSMGPRTPNEEANCTADGIAAGHVDDRRQLRSLTGGNPDLGPETANIFTSGLVYEPTFAPGLSFTFDYFNIKIDKAISSLGAQLILQSCYDLPPNARKMEYCDLIERDENNQIQLIRDTLINVGGNDTAGLDFNVRYNQGTDVGAFNFNLEGTWLQEFNSIEPDGSVIEGRGVYDLGVYPRWRFNFGTLWGKDEWGAGANLRYIGRFRECFDNNCKLGTEPDPDRPGEFRNRRPEDTDDRPISRDVGAHVTADLYGSYTLESPIGNSRLSLGVNNVIDAKPAVIYNGFLGTSDASTYDFLGRYFYARFVQQF
jgi:outer membrane receptor protein involved in Fe transport